MKKTFFRGLAISISVFAFALLVGYLAYFFTIDYVNDKNLSNTSTIDNNVVAEDVTSQTVPVHEEDVRVIDHYLARLDGDVVSVYICGNFGEEFLYNLDVYLNDLPKGDIEKLKAGVVLKTKQELTSFEEDYTS